MFQALRTLNLRTLEPEGPVMKTLRCSVGGVASSLVHYVGGCIHLRKWRVTASAQGEGLWRQYSKAQKSRCVRSVGEQGGWTGRPGCNRAYRRGYDWAPKISHGSELGTVSNEFKLWSGFGRFPRGERERERERDLYFSVVTGTRYGTKTPPGRQPAN